MGGLSSEPLRELIGTTEAQAHPFILARTSFLKEMDELLHDTPSPTPLRSSHGHDAQPVVFPQAGEDRSEFESLVDPVGWKPPVAHRPTAPFLERRAVEHSETPDECMGILNPSRRIRVEQANHESLRTSGHLNLRGLCQRREAAANRRSILRLQERHRIAPGHVTEDPQTKQAAQCEAVGERTAAACEHFGCQETRGTASMGAYLAEVGQHHTTRRGEQDIARAHISMMSAKSVDLRQRVRDPAGFGERLRHRDRPRGERLSIDPRGDEPPAPSPLDQLEGRGQVR
jgi:hypothetical protein